MTPDRYSYTGLQKRQRPATHREINSCGDAVRETLRHFPRTDLFTTITFRAKGIWQVRTHTESDEGFETGKIGVIGPASSADNP